MSQAIDNAQVIVTGASRGIGLAIAEELDRRGFAVVGLSRSGTSSVGRAIACDVSDERSIRSVFAEIATNGPIAGIVNNAGTHGTGPSQFLETDEYERIMSTNATSVMIGCREIHPHLARAGSGLIVNMGSFFDKVGAAQQLAYCASKAAIGAMTRVLAVEWARDGISVMNIAPGYIETEFTPMWKDEKALAWLRKRVPMKRGGTTEEVARLIGALFSEDIGFLTGETIYMDGAHSLHH